MILTYIPCPPPSKGLLTKYVISYVQQYYCEGTKFKEKIKYYEN